MDATQSAPGVKSEPIWRSSAPHTAEIFFTESANYFTLCGVVVKVSFGFGERDSDSAFGILQKNLATYYFTKYPTFSVVAL